MAAAEGIPQPIISRAAQLYQSLYTHHPSSPLHPSPCLIPSPPICCLSELQNLITHICRDRLAELFEEGSLPVRPRLKCVVVAPRELPPPSTVRTSGVYVMFRPDNTLYIGQTDDLQGRIRGHRAMEGMKNNTFIYFTVPGKSIACQLETLIINRLSSLGFHLTNVADGHHRNFASLSMG